MAWSYNGVTGILTSTGTTRAAPDGLLAGAAAVMAIDPTKGFRDGNFGWVNNVVVAHTGSAIRHDNDALFELRGSSRFTHGSGTYIGGWRATLHVLNTTSAIDNACAFGGGSSFITEKQRANDAPYTVKGFSGIRFDIFNVQANTVMALTEINGLHFYGIGGCFQNLKVYYGRATTSSVKDMAFFMQAQAQQYASTYDDCYFESLKIDSEGGLSNIIHNRPVYGSTSKQSFNGALRGGRVTIINPTFRNACWNRTVGWASDVNANSWFNLGYTYQFNFKDAFGPVEGVNVRFTRARRSITANPAPPTWADPPDAVITVMSDAQGASAPAFLRSSYRAGTADRYNLEVFEWSAKARTHNRRAASELILDGADLHVDEVYMGDGYIEPVLMLDIPYSPATVADGLAITGITYDAAGNATLTESRTTLELFHSWMAHSSLPENLDWLDTWRHDGTTLRMGDSDLILADGVTLTGNLITTATVTGQVNGTYTDATGTRVLIKSGGSYLLSTQVKLNGTYLGWQPQQAARALSVQPTDVVEIYAISHGYKPNTFTFTGAELAQNAVLNLNPEVFVNTTLPTATRDTIAASFDSGQDAFGRIYLSIDSNMRDYTPAEVINGLQYYLVTEGALIATAALEIGSVAGFELLDGGFIIRTPGFYGKVADSITEDTDRGIYIPLYVLVDPAVYVADPTFAEVRKNANGVVLGVALYPKTAASITEQDQQGIASRAAASVRPDLQVINTGVQKTSLGIPHSGNLT